MCEQHEVEIEPNRLREISSADFIIGGNHEFKDKLNDCEEENQLTKTIKRGPGRPK